MHKVVILSLIALAGICAAPQQAMCQPVGGGGDLGEITSFVPFVNNVQNETDYDWGDDLKVTAEATVTNSLNATKYFRIVISAYEVGTPNHLVGSYSSTVELDPDEEHNFAGTLQWESEPDIEQYLFTVELVYLDSIGGLEQAIGIDADNEVFNLQ